MLSEAVTQQVRAALAGQSNDVEHDALVAVAHELGIDGTVIERNVARARQVVARYSDRAYRTDGPAGYETDIADVVTDLLHLAEAEGVDGEVALQRARDYYAGDKEEATGDGD